MKNLASIFFVLSLVLTGCNNKLDKETAADLITKKYKYPKVLDFEIFCGDPVHARRVLDLGLEKAGMVKVDRTQKLRDIGNPLIHFTDLAKPYLLKTPKEDKYYNIQNIKIAEERIGEITRILNSSSDKDITIVEYTVVRKKNIFSPLWPNLKDESESKAYFYFTKDGWQIIDKSDVELMNLRIY